MGKATKAARPPPRVYRDDPDRDDAASTSSAVPLQGVEFHDEESNYPDAELPAYEDVPSISSVPNASAGRDALSVSYFNQPPLLDSFTSQDQTTTTTLHLLYSQDISNLKSMLESQVQIPPTWTCRLTGTHTQTTHKANDKTEKQTITDFDVHLDMTHLLVPTASTSPRLLTPDFILPEASTKAYRGDRIQTRWAASPTHAEESAPDIDSYLEAYISSPHPVRSFTLNRSIIHHDSALLEKQLRSLIGSTNYRGHLKISFPTTHRRVTVLSPCWQNTYRSHWLIRWFFYLTFLWLVSWPYLWFMTRRWEVLTKQYPYSCCIDNCGNRKFVTRSEEAFFQEWKASLRRAVLGRKQGWVDEEYKLQTEVEMAQGVVSGLQQRMPLPTPPRTGNAIADGAMGVLQQAAVLGRDVAMAGGWGADN